MSKNHKKTITLNVETVDKLKLSLSWITTTINFWGLEKKWPTNLIKDVAKSCYELLVSSSHIIDK